MADARPSYKSWKKKYRKMRIQFDVHLEQSEELHKLEQKAIRTMKRLAVENDRLMDMLLDINDSPQIPFERRIDISAHEPASENEADDTQKPAKSLRKLQQTVPHRSFAATVQVFPSVQEELAPKNRDTEPTAFLTADDIDNYLYEIDLRLGLKPQPSLAPNAHGAAGSTAAHNYALRNPTSVYNWLRKHAPKTFLQDMEKDDNEKGEKVDGRKRKNAAGEGKRRSTMSKKDKERLRAAEGGWDEDGSHDGQSTKGKRKRDDDPGYRPKGGNSRPVKKRKSGSVGGRKSMGDR
ncbi:IEC3 subunit of the Ino80 complex, chromatin re-modelling-domain-containing protein [Microdochium trichocladiopsis]|uniref:IEC3 subunit of the Ino80 complex, chromatin re-modelling-domain-containing protein n=1 Tax=Microdochium trichocladiopsis TaxID=1682393 RepID=A0A9P8Y3B5_9PEZI|nr:IEC3 subunit of the Ino80 complex, chromatin re-modelling-domain-containing protein [Microdochium trichocladiopsis]KAH7026422.1 IEC3 subunit of the Ino80 complex, chromatin re-modelling-domain-containing protein [Microdochium trichocladiopsis]